MASAAALAVWLAGFPCAAQTIDVKASVDRATVPVGTPLQFTVAVSGAQGNIPKPQLPQLPDFNIIQTYQSSSIQMINGAISASANITYVLIPMKEGQLTIPAATVVYQGKNYQTNPITITATPGNAPPPPQAQRQQQPPPGPAQQQSGGYKLSEAQEKQIPPNQRFFATAALSKSKAFENERMVYTLSLFWHRASLRQIQIEPPEFVGFWSEQIREEPNPQEVVINGYRFGVADIRFLLYPLAPGEKTIEGAGAVMDFGFFDGAREVKAPAVKANIVALPSEGKPADFTGAVGDYKIWSKVDPSEVAENKAVALKVTIKGEGNIRTVQEPALELPPDIAQYDAKITENLSASGEVLTGEKTFEYLIIPRAAGDYSLPPLSLSYFDPKAKKYKTTQSEAMQLKVTPGDKEAVNILLGGDNQSNVEILKREINHIKTEDRRGFLTSGPIYKNPLYLALHGIPILALACLSLIRGKRKRLATDSAFARSDRAMSAAEKRLRGAAALQRKNQSEAFYAEISKALSSYLADKFDVSSAGILTAETLDELRARGVEAEAVETFERCLRTCDAARYAPGTLNEGSMGDTLANAKKAISILEREL